MRDSAYYPAGAYNDPSAPYNQPDVEDRDFEVTCIQVLSKATTVTTNNYIPGDSGCDYESDDEGGVAAYPWEDEPDTSDTNWIDEYNREHYNPLQLIALFKEYLENELSNNELPQNKINKYKCLIEECSDWIEDDIEVVYEKD